LGEVSLVDVSSPVFQSGLLFHEILFDENAACHIAFGEAYPECVEGAANLSREDLEELGVNFSDTHVDFMIGTPTMNVTGLCADGREIPIMRAGRFVEAITA
jgi:aminopeptidase